MCAAIMTLCGIITLVVSLATFTYSSSSTPQSPWDEVDTILNTGLANSAYPGAVAIVVTKSGTVYSKAVGSFTFGIPPPFSSDNPAVTLDTIWDMASLTKVLMTGTACMQLYEQGWLALDTPVSQYLGPDFNSHPNKDKIVVRNLMVHNAGYAPEPMPSWWGKTFACPSTSQYTPPLTYSCQAAIHKSLLAQPLAAVPGTKFVYSDVSMITMMFVIGNIARRHTLVKESDLTDACVHASGAAINITSSDSLPIDQCYYEAYTRLYVIKALNLQRSWFNPPSTVWSGIAPTENDTWYRHEVVQGRVHDENAYVSGGVQGHAGLFQSGVDTATLMHRLLFADTYQPNHYHINASTVNMFITPPYPDRSSRALVWDTNEDMPRGYHDHMLMPTHLELIHAYAGCDDGSWYSSCGSLSTKTYMHTGFTGTLTCADPTRGVIAILHCNRVYPTRNNTRHSAVRNAFTSAVQRIIDAHYTTPS